MHKAKRANIPCKYTLYVHSVCDVFNVIHLGTGLFHCCPKNTNPKDGNLISEIMAANRYNPKFIFFPEIFSFTWWPGQTGEILIQYIVISISGEAQSIDQMPL